MRLNSRIGYRSATLLLVAASACSLLAPGNEALMGGSSDAGEGGVSGRFSKGGGPFSGTAGQAEGGSDTRPTAGDGPVGEGGDDVGQCSSSTASLRSDVENCGECGHVCELSNAEAACVEGQCVVAACEEGFDDCTNAAGCETPVTTNDNCGGCGVRCTLPTVCIDGACGNPSQGLNERRWDVPCGEVIDYDDLCRDLPSNAVCPAAGHDPVEKTITFSGVRGMFYDVALRFRGVVEPKVYTGGTALGNHFYVGGTPQVSNFNAFSLQVSSPAKLYYLNQDATERRAVFPIDYYQTISVEGGATLTLRVHDPDCAQVRNCIDLAAATCAPYIVNGVFPAPAPYNGQFIQVDVVSFKEHKALPTGNASR